MVEVSDNSSHELEIAATRGGDRDGICQTSGKRKDAENDEVDDEEGFVQHDRGSWVFFVFEYQRACVDEVGYDERMQSREKESWRGRISLTVL